MVYTYDTWGNLATKKIYAYTTATNPGTPTSTITYGYGNSAWKDQLTSYNGQTIAYEPVYNEQQVLIGYSGNPAMYRGKTLSWYGNQLTKVAQGTSTIASYVYDSNGLRQRKTVSGTNTDYCYNGSVLIGLTKSSDKLRFSYDAAGQVQAVDFNGTYYYYLRNGQGDIVKIIDGSGAAKVEYTYDSWGKQLSCTGTLATTLGALNPFRYRGYVYDEETQWYYLKSRYYDPETCRFISADVLLSTGQGVLGHNTYAYCLNDPISWIDPAGTDIEDIFEWLKNFFGAEARTTYRKRTRNVSKSSYLFIFDIEAGTETNNVSRRSGNSSKPVSVYSEARADNYVCSSVGLCFNIGSLSVDLSFGLDNTGVTIGYDRGNGSSWSF